MGSGKLWRVLLVNGDAFTVEAPEETMAKGMAAACAAIKYGYGEAPEVESVERLPASQEEAYGQV